MVGRPHKFTFYLDENFPITAGKFFAAKGHAFLLGKNELGEGKTDRQHLTQATKQQAILVSSDNDFTTQEKLLRASITSPGVILLQVNEANLNHLRTVINRILKDAKPKTFAGKLCIASIDKIEFKVYES